MSKDPNICLGAIAGAHGVRGAVRIKCFTENPLDISAYGPVHTEDGSHRYIFGDVRVSKGDQVIAAIEGLYDRDAAEKLKGTRLYVNRDKLPELEEDSWYHADLIGLKAEMSDGTFYGKVIALHDFGAGDLIEIKKGDKKTILFPFTKEIVPAVDISTGKIVISPPEEISAQDQSDQGDQE